MILFVGNFNLFLYSTTSLYVFCDGCLPGAVAFFMMGIFPLRLYYNTSPSKKEAAFLRLPFSNTQLLTSSFIAPRGSS